MKYNDLQAIQAGPHLGIANTLRKVTALVGLLLLSAAPGWAQAEDAPTVTIRTLPSGGISASESRRQEARPAPRPRRRVRRAVRPRPIPPPVASAPVPASTAAPRRERREVRRFRRSRPTRIEAAAPRQREERVTASPRTRRPVASTNSEGTRPRGGENATTLNARGFRLTRQGRFAEAESYLRRAVELQPDYGYALYNLGVALLEQGKAFEAVRPLERTASLQPTRWEPQQRLAETYAAMGNLTRSRAAAERARELRMRRSARN